MLAAEAEGGEFCDTAPGWYLNVPEDFFLQYLSSFVLEFHGKCGNSFPVQIEDDGRDLVVRPVSCINVVAACPYSLECHTIGVEGQLGYVEGIYQGLLVSEHVGA